MRKSPWITMFLLLQLIPLVVSAQDSLLNILKDEKPPVNYAEAAFKATRIVIGQSIENPAQGNMLLLITHHFGTINSGYENLFGLKI